MPTFDITALNDRGQILRQSERADSERELRERLMQQGYLVRSVRLQGSTFGGRRGERVSIGKFIVFNQQFVTLVKAGLPILRALELLASRTRDPRLARMLDRVRQRVQSGELLSEAFRQEPTVPEIYTTTLMAGEKSGNLEEVLYRYIQYRSLALSLRKKLVASLIYPAVLMVMVVVLLTFLVTYVVPQFASLYNSLNAQLPAMTVFVLALGQSLQKSMLWAVLGLGAVAAGVYYLLRRGLLTRWLDGAVLRMPLLGDLWWKYQVAMLSRTLSTLLLGGIPAVQALDTAATALRSGRLRKGLSETVREVRQGESISVGLSRHRVMPDLAIEMIEAGEGTGALPQMLASVAAFYDEDLSNAVTALLALIEPAILIVVGSVVAVILISLYLPIFSLGANIR